MLKLNLIGGGQVGKALAYLLTQKTDLVLQCVLNRSLESGKAVCDFIQQGKAVIDYSAFTPADCYLITVHDQEIKSCVEKLVTANVLVPGNIVVHCSGFMPSSVMSLAATQGVYMASMHPIKSFVDPARSVQTFQGTFCALEGDQQACDLLNQWIEAIGGVSVEIQAHEKAIYHAALVMASNYLVVLHEMALRSLEKAGISHELNQKILMPIMRHTLEQSLQFGTTKALSGPIARGDAHVVETELKALKQWDVTMGELYRGLGEIALQLAKQQGLEKTRLEKTKSALAVDLLKN